MMTTVASLKRQIFQAMVCPWIGRLVARFYRNRIPKAGCVIDTHSRLITPRVKAMIFWGFYEQSEIKFIQRYLRRDLDVIELGGSLGVVTCQIRKRLDDVQKLVSVEADARLQDEIEGNLRLNRLPEVEVISRAIDYHTPPRPSVSFTFGGSNLSGTTGQLLAGRESVQVATTTLSQLLKEYALGNYTLVADIEGAEVGIALQEAEALKACHQLIIELHPTTFEGKSFAIPEMVRLFTEVHGFRIRAHEKTVYVFERGT